MYEKLHKENAGYGSDTCHHFNKISNFIDIHKPQSILDFGCGKGSLERLITKQYPNISVDSYDPAIEERRTIPNSSYDMIISTDVLEHLFEDEIEGIFKEMLHLKPKTMYHIICHRSAHQILEDGTNAHKCVQTPEWWSDAIGGIAKDYTVSFTNIGTESGFFELVL